MPQYLNVELWGCVWLARETQQRGPLLLFMADKGKPASFYCMGKLGRNMVCLVRKFRM